MPSTCETRHGAVVAEPSKRIEARLGRHVRLFLRSTSAATAVEFALVSTALIPLILFVMLVGIIFYYNQALDFATNKASRQIMIGAVQKSGLSQSDFQTQLCSYLSSAFICSNVVVNVYTLAEAAGPNGYYAFVNSNQTALNIPSLSNGSAQFSVGTQGAYQYMQVIYPITFIPAMFANILGQSTFNGSPAYLAVSTAAFRNEQY